MRKFLDLLFVMLIALTFAVASGCSLNVGDDDDDTVALDDDDDATTDDDDDNDDEATDDDDDNDTAGAVDLADICDVMLDCDGDTPSWPSTDDCVADFWGAGCEDESGYLECMVDCVDLVDCGEFYDCGTDCYDLCMGDYSSY
jgi:hypothetical protein